MEDQVEKVESYKCKWCGELYGDEIYANECAFKHAQHRLANTMLRKGYGLWSINHRCGFNWKLKEDQNNITQDNCFIVSHWQCCYKPAYRITEIEKGGYIRLYGHGGGMGGYGDIISLGRLPKAYPKEELFVYKNS